MRANKLKQFLTIVAVIMPIGAHALTMCVHDDTYVATLLRSRDGQSITLGADKSYTVTFDYFTSSKNTSVVDGVAACNEISGTNNTADKTLSTSMDDIGTHCWCQMIRPLVSDWVFVNTYGSDASCAAECAGLCANRLKLSTPFRTALYESIW